VEVAEIPANFYWVRLRNGRKIADSYYQGKDEDEALRTIGIVQQVADKVEDPAEPEILSSIKDLKLTRSNWNRVSLLVAQWANKLDRDKGPTDVEVGLVVAGIWKTLSGGKLPTSGEGGPIGAPKTSPSRVRTVLPSSKMEGQQKSYSLEDIRSKHKRAYERWSSAEEDKLKKAYGAGQSVDQIAQALGRQPGGIRSRLQKLGLVD
jgi:hypothetical protein